jgi:hypothetical protein
MKKRLIFAVAAAVALAACADASTAPTRQLRPGDRTADDITCRSGYHVATRSDGTEYCEEDGGGDALMGRARSDSL